MGGANKQPPFADQRLEAIVTVRKREKSAAANHIPIHETVQLLARSPTLTCFSQRAAESVAVLPVKSWEPAHPEARRRGSVLIMRESAGRKRDARERLTEKRRQRAPGERKMEWLLRVWACTGLKHKQQVHGEERREGEFH